MDFDPLNGYDETRQLKILEIDKLYIKRQVLIELSKYFMESAKKAQELAIEMGNHAAKTDHPITKDWMENSHFFNYFKSKIQRENSNNLMAMALPPFKRRPKK